MLSSQHDSTNYCGVTVIDHKQPSPVSNLSTTKQFDTDSKNYDITHSFATPIEHNHVTLEKPETTTTNTPVQTNVYSRLFQMSSSTSTTSLKLPPSVKEFFSE